MIDKDQRVTHAAITDMPRSPGTNIAAPGLNS